MISREKRLSHLRLPRSVHVGLLRVCSLKLESLAIKPHPRISEDLTKLGALPRSA